MLAENKKQEAEKTKDIPYPRYLTCSMLSHFVLAFSLPCTFSFLPCTH